MILAAGVGSRLGKPHPKPLTPIAGGRTIMDLQLRHLSDRFDANMISTVVGFKKEMIMEEHPEVSYIYNEISKEVVGGLGEAVGINFVGSSDKPFLAARLEDCGPQDYFERGIELAIGRDRRRFRAVDISSARCMEVDFPTDLAEAESTFADLGPSRKG